MSPITLVSYTLGITIRTREYENIRPEITIQAQNIEQAEAFLTEWANTTYKTYSPTEVKSATPMTVVIPDESPEPEEEKKTETKQHSTAYNHAKNMLKLVKTKEEKEEVFTKIRNGKVLHEWEKQELLKM